MTLDVELDADRLPLQMAILTCGYAPDSPEGYAVRVIMLLRTAQEQLQAGSMDEAMATAFVAGEIVNEAAMKGMFEPDVLRGEAVREGGQKGHAQAYGTAAEKAAKRERILVAYQQELAQGVGQMEAYRHAAKKCGVSPRTVRRMVEQTKR